MWSGFNSTSEPGPGSGRSPKLWRLSFSGLFVSLFKKLSISEDIHLAGRRVQPIIRDEYHLRSRIGISRVRRTVVDKSTCRIGR